MITTIVLLTLVFAILGKPAGWCVKKLEGVDWKILAQDAWGKIVAYSKKAGRSATRKVLRLYYAMTEGSLSTYDKALVLAAIIYIIVPRDFLPKSVFGWLGILDDAGAAAFVYAKVKKSITRIVAQKAEDTLNEWFGPEVVTGLIVDLSEE